MNSSKIKPSEIKRQIERICVSTEFRGKKKLCQLLRFLVDETQSGHADTLQGYQIGLGVFGRDKDFDPDHDPIVRIQAGRLRRSLYFYYLVEGKDDPIHVVIPKGGYKPQFLSSEDVQALIGEDHNSTSKNSRNLQREPSIAVLPFDNLTGDKEKEYFAQGFSEELSIELTQYEDLMVIGCRLTPGSEQELEDLQNLSRKMGVHFLIQGSVRLESTKITVLIKLIDGINIEQIWAERYQRDLSAGNLAQIQEEIARETAAVLGSEYGIVLQRLSRESLQRKPDNLDTYDAILRFYYYETHMSPDAAREAFKALDQALRNDPGNGIATAMLASLYGNLYLLDRADSAGAKEKIIELADMALRLDPNSPAVNIVYAWKYFVCDERKLFFEAVNKCLAMKLQSPMRKGSLGFYLSLYGEWDSGKALLDEAMNHAVGFPLYYYGATTLYYYRKHAYEQALKEAENYQVPALFWGPLLRAAVLGQLGRRDEAQPEIKELISLKADFDVKAHYLISRFVKEDQLVEHIIKGLRKAGMDINGKGDLA